MSALGCEPPQNPQALISPAPVWAFPPGSARVARDMKVLIATLFAVLA
jgi:hypothetical protein